MVQGHPNSRIGAPQRCWIDRIASVRATHKYYSTIAIALAAMPNPIHLIQQRPE